MHGTIQPTSCPVHGDLAHDLARGALAAGTVRQAEETVAVCRSCTDLLAGLAVASVSRGVADAVAAFRPPRQRPVEHRWMLRVAAAAMLLIAGTAAWWAAEQDAPPEALQPTAAVTSSPAVEPHRPAAAATKEILFTDGFESRSLDAWRVYPPS